MNRFIKCRGIFTASCFIKNWERKSVLHGRYSVILGAVPLSKCWLSAGVLHYVTKSWQTAYVLMCLLETSNKYWTEAAKTKIIYSSSNIDNHFDKHFLRQATISYPESSGLLFSGWAPGETGIIKLSNFWLVVCRTVEHRQEVSQSLTLFIVIKSSFLLSLFFFFLRLVHLRLITNFFLNFKRV